MKRTAGFIALVVGCGSSAPPATSRQTPAERAELILRADAPFDLTLPGRTPPSRHPASDALVAACRDGHHPS